MIKITDAFASTGRNFGNKLFTYSLGLIISKENDLNLEIPNNSLIQRNGVNELFPFSNITNKRTINDTQYYVCDSNLFEKGLETCLNESKNSYVFLDGYFSKYDYIKNYKNYLREEYASIILKKNHTDDVLIMLRDSNADSTFVLPKEYYLDLLNSLTFDKLYISYDHYSKHVDLINILKNKYEVVLLDLNIIDLFKEITSHNTIIGAQGTFSFWVSLLSDANKIFWPITKQGPNIIGHRDVNLIVDDESRYEFIML